MASEPQWRRELLAIPERLAELPAVDHFGWELSCNASTQCGTTSAFFDVFDLQLEAYEYQTPNIVAGPISGSHNLWYQAGRWVHGSLPVDLAASDPSGVCRALVSWDGLTVQDTGERSPNSAYWDQCDPDHASNSQQIFFSDATVNTSTAVPGSRMGVPLVLKAHNASVIPWIGTPDWTTDSELLNVDNLPVALSLSGPTDAPITAGTQYISAIASSGPSGVGSIMCSVDGSTWAPEELSGAGRQTATAQIPVSGLGVHTVSCQSANRAVDGNGLPTSSEIQVWTLRIGEPVHIYAGFPRIIHDCHRVRTRSRKRVKSVRRCHSRTQDQQLKRVSFGHSVKLSGWVATTDGTALAHVPVRILTAPDEDSYAWQEMGVVTTSADGTWSVTLPPGPSRLIRAVYDGGPTTESASSSIAKAIVSAKIELSHMPSHVPWGGVLVIRGRVLGGYIPAEQILQVRSGVGRHLQVIGNPYIHPSRPIRGAARGDRFRRPAPHADRGGDAAGDQLPVRARRLAPRSCHDRVAASEPRQDWTRYSLSLEGRESPRRCRRRCLRRYRRGRRSRPGPGPRY